MRQPALLMAFLILTSPGWAMTAIVDTQGYHPNAPKTIALKDVPADAKQPLQLKVIDPKTLDPIFLKPKVIYKATVEGRNPKGEWLLPVSDLKTPGTYQLQWGKVVLAEPLTITPGRYWLQAQTELARLFSLQVLPAKCGELACETEPHYLAHSGQGWRTDAKARQKITAENALALLMLMQWHQINPKVQTTLQLGYERPGVLPVVEGQLRWLMDMQGTKGTHAGMRWATNQRCYTLLPEQTDTTLITIATLAKASQVYKKTDLGFAVKNLMMAEDLWQHLPKTLPPDSAQLLGLASAQLWLATQKPMYETGFWQSIKRLQPTAYSSSTPLALAVVDMIKWGDLSPDQKSWLSDWLTQPLPQLDTLNGLSQRLLVAMTQDNTPALDQVASHLPTIQPEKTLTGLSQWVWMQGLLNELYNQLPTSAMTANQKNMTTPQAEGPLTPQSVLTRWAAKRHNNSVIQSTVPATP